MIDVYPERHALPLKASGRIKLIVWDLDNTIWNGTLLEGDTPPLLPRVIEIIKELDTLGVLHSIASRNDRSAAIQRLDELGIKEFFLCPQIEWTEKSVSIKQIAHDLGISLDAVLFIDDQLFELEEVAYALPEVLTLVAPLATMLMDDPHFLSLTPSPEAHRRRKMYIDEQQRKQSEESFEGPAEEFLALLNLVLSVRRCASEDLGRAEELVLRTNQLNSTGVMYSQAELETFIESPAHELLIAHLSDRFGDYGQIGIALLNLDQDHWTIKLLLVSCRVLSRGIGTILLNHIADSAAARGKRLVVEYMDTGRNRPMKIALMIAGFNPIESANSGLVRYARSLPAPQKNNYVNILGHW